MQTLMVVVLSPVDEYGIIVLFVLEMMVEIGLEVATAVVFFLEFSVYPVVLLLVVLIYDFLMLYSLFSDSVLFATLVFLLLPYSVALSLVFVL